MVKVLEFQIIGEHRIRCDKWKKCRIAKEYGCVISFYKGEKHICPLNPELQQLTKKQKKMFCALS